MTEAQSNSSSNDMIYNPPPLPDYLSRNHNLNIIAGVPTDEEVKKAIHDVIRAVNSVSTVTALYDHKLSTRLAQHLFTIQMGKLAYWQYFGSSNLQDSCVPKRVSIWCFSEENTYKPPPVPSHMPISLEPVVGAPSYVELESAHDAVRILEGLAHSN
ncbi:hypothetical protein ACGC1H_000204 [Rhizoctonia solani]|uniref:Uncharacterized protein n=1 Tax=Rhizoctonia solani TaxID=456999 RepID=A0A8H3BH55_9AGAM|nr:unnamed protein product [Rhizoctonia solani]